MRSHLRALSAREDGLTLVELITSSALTMVVLAAMLGMFGGMQRYSARQAARSEATDQVRVAMDRMTKEIRQATRVRTTSTSDYLDIDTYVNGSVARVIYDARTGNRITRTVGTTTLPMIERLVDTDVFSYSSDPATAEPSVIALSIEARPAKFAIDESSVTLTSEVQLRNR